MTRKLILLVFLAIPSIGQAKEAAPAAASDQSGYIRVLGRLNVNTASRAQLELVPGLDSSKIDGLLRARSAAPIADLGLLGLPEDALDHLKTEGESNLYRVRQNPLRRVSPAPGDGTQQASAGAR
jgi:hypothetical protein